MKSAHAERTFSHAEHFMTTELVLHTNRVSKHDVVHEATNRGVDRMVALKAKTRAVAKIQAVVYAATRDLNLARQVPRGLRRLLYECRTRRCLSRDKSEFTEFLAQYGANVTNAQAW